MKTLNGLRILVTRPAHQAENLCHLIRQHGGIAVRFPTVDIVEHDNQILIRETLAKLTEYHYLIFVSANAVNFALKANNGKIERINTLKLAAIGQSTAETLVNAGLSVDLMPSPPFNSEALLALPEMQTVQGQHILIVRGEGGRETLARNLRDRGANVHYLNVYKRIKPTINNVELIYLLEQNKLNIITVTSGEILQNLLSLLETSYHQRLFNLPLIVVSDRIKHIAREMGFKQITVTNNPSDKAILETIN